MHRETVKFT